MSPERAGPEMRALRSKVRKRALKGLTIRYEHLDPEHVSAELDALEDSTIAALEGAMFVHPPVIRAIDVRQLMLRGVGDVDFRELAAFGDALRGLNAEEKLLRVRELHNYDLPGLRGVPDLSAAAPEAQSICRALLACLGLLCEAFPAPGAAAASGLFLTVPARTSARVISGIADPELLHLVADYPDRADEITGEVGQHGVGTLGVLRERFENVAARSLGTGWL